MYPILERQVLHPPMGHTAVIRNDVHQNLQTTLVGLLDILTIQLVATHTGVDVVVVGTGIAVVGVVRLVVQQEGRGPDGRHTQVGNVVEVVDDALQVATVTAVQILTVGLLGRRGGAVDGRVAIGKAVGHQQVDDIRGGKALALGRPCTAFCQRIGDLELLVATLKEEVNLPRRSRGLNLDVEEEVVGAVGLVHFTQANPLAYQLHLTGRDLFALHQELQRGLHTNPPRQRLKAGHSTLGLGHSRHINLRCRGTRNSCHSDKRNDKLFEKHPDLVGFIWSEYSTPKRRVCTPCRPQRSASRPS